MAQVPVPAVTAGAPELELEGRLVEDGGAVRIAIRGGVIAGIERLARDPATDAWIGPGWLDIQVNGFGGFDANAPDADAATVSGMVKALWAWGTTGVCPTICTQSEERIVRSLRAVADACAADPLVAAAVVGIHVEGPHIAREDGPRGAHPLEHVRPPDVGEYRRWQAAAGGRIRMITVSPEYDEAIPYIEAIVADGVVASIGHTAANGAQIRAAVDAGARSSTHLGNGAHATLPRHPNYVWDQLAEDRLTAGLILDGHHLPPAVIRAMIRAKGIERCILVSDALAIAGLPAGVYASAVGGEVELLPSGRLTLRGTPYLAGSVATLTECLGNALRHAGLTLSEAVRLVTANPSRLLGLEAGRGHERIRLGAAASLTIFRQASITADPSIVATIVDGQLVSGALAG